MVFGLFGSVAHELHFCVCAGIYRLLICYGPLPVFFFTASKLQFRHRVEGLRTHRFWLARARLVVAFGLFGSVASSFGTMWKGCERTVFGCLLACVLHALGTNLAAVRGFRKLRITSSTAIGVAVCWFRTQPRSEGAGHKTCFMASKGNGKHFCWLVFCMPWARSLLPFEAFGSFA